MDDEILTPFNSAGTSDDRAGGEATFAVIPSAVAYRVKAIPPEGTRRQPDEGGGEREE